MSRLLSSECKYFYEDFPSNVERLTLINDIFPCTGDQEKQRFNMIGEIAVTSGVLALTYYYDDEPGPLKYIRNVAIAQGGLAVIGIASKAIKDGKDIGNVGKEIEDAAKDIFNFGEDTSRQIREKVIETGKNAYEDAQKAGEWVVEEAKKTEKSVEQWANQVADDMGLGGRGFTGLPGPIFQPSGPVVVPVTPPVSGGIPTLPTISDPAPTVNTIVKTVTKETDNIKHDIDNTISTIGREINKIFPPPQKKSGGFFGLF